MTVGGLRPAGGLDDEDFWRFRFYSDDAGRLSRPRTGIGETQREALLHKKGIMNLFLVPFDSVSLSIWPIHPQRVTVVTL